MKKLKNHYPILISRPGWQIPLLVILSLLLVNTLWADNLTWAPNTSSPSDGDGSWLGGDVWWDGSSIVSGTWTGSTPDGAIFGNGTAGAYTVDMGGNSIFVTNLVFNTSGYTLQNGGITQWGYGPSGKTIISVGANVSATIAAGFTNLNTGGGNSTISVGNGGLLTLSGGGNNPGNLVTTGGGTVDFQSGTYSGGNFVLWAQGNVTQEAATLNVQRLLLGYGGNATLTVDSPSAVINDGAGGGDFTIGRGGNTGVFDLKQGTVTMTSGTAANNNVKLVNNDSSGSKGTLTVEGGNLTLGSGANMGSILVNQGTAAGTAATFNMSGGTVKANGVTIGGGGSYASGSTATVNMTGGSLYLSSGGFSKNYSGPLTVSVSLSGGTIGALADWSSTVDAILGTTGGNITFKTADDVGSAHNIVWNGVLSGAGGLIDIGPGMLTLGGLNTYKGNTTVNGNMLLANAGQLSFKIGVNDVNNQIDGTGKVTLDGSLNFDLSDAGTTIGDTWVILDSANGLTVTYGSGFTINGFTQNGDIWTSGNYQYDEANNTLSYIPPVPEPGSTALFMGGVGILFASCRFRRR